ncbi:MAG: mechanosensitive ion channel [Rhodobacteraceae bacterium]|nr:mechanosensitive ion channel [Paracoccaceae bacterium]
MEPLRILHQELAGLLAGLVGLLPNLLAALVVLLLTWLVASVVRRIARRLVGRTRLRPSLYHALVSLLRIGFWVVGLMVAATVLFPNLTPTKLLAGLGLGSLAIGLAFRDIFENFLAGILILIRKPMKIGDDVVCEGVSGRVEQITIRDTYLRKRSGELVLLPNSFLYKNPTEVLTDRPQRRITLEIGVAYGSDIRMARKVIRGVLDHLDTVDSSRPVDVFATGFGDSSIGLLACWWTGSTPIAEHRSRDQAAAAIKSALDEAGIEIPFPQRMLSFRDPVPLASKPGR